MMPQWEFLDFLPTRRAAFPGFALRDGGRGRGLRRRAGAWPASGSRGRARAARGKLVIAADGRASLRPASAAAAGRDLGAPMDVFWFRLPKADGARTKRTGVVDRRPDHGADRPRRLLAMRLHLPEGHGRRGAGARARAHSASEVAGRAPDPPTGRRSRRAGTICKLLSVKLDRLEQWHRPGLLVIGDAAHAMSPIGGVGINVAIQDAVAAANILAGPMARGRTSIPCSARCESGACSRRG